MSGELDVNLYEKKETDGVVGYECKECGRLYGDWVDRDCDHSLPKLNSSSEHVPHGLKQEDIWFVWDEMHKMPLAPWRTGHMFPTKWGSGVLDDPDYDHKKTPETEFQKAQIIADMDTSVVESEYSQVVSNWKGRDGKYNKSDLSTPRGITPTIMLLPEERMPDRGLVFVDFDDVRNVATGEVTEEVKELVERLDTYVEISTSRTGLHAFLWGSLPDGVTQLQAELDETGHIEMYDSGRFVGNTWEHVDRTPYDVRPDDGIVKKIVEEYGGENPATRRSYGGQQSFSGEFDADEVNDYYTKLDIRNVADQKKFAEYRQQAPSDQWQGPHPIHGAQSGPEWDSDSTNTNVRPGKGQWYCHLHDVGGSALSLIPVVEEWIECTREIDNPREVMTPRMVLKTCLTARDKYDPEDKLSGVEPPYGALIAVADMHDLPFENDANNRLGSLTEGTATTIYKQMTADDVVLD
jgi:hypothetical protein